MRENGGIFIVIAVGLAHFYAKNGVVEMGRSAGEWEGMGFGAYPVSDVQHLTVAMRDGVRLALKLWLPTDDLTSDPFRIQSKYARLVYPGGKGPRARKTFGTVMEYIPYSKDYYTMERDQARHSWWCSHGFASIRVDIRGSGASEGLYFDEYTQQELDDGAEVIAWVAAQAWSNGKVGLFGKSWGGFNGLMLAAEQAPGLATAISLYSTEDRYTDDVHYMGGTVLGTGMVSWANQMFLWNSRPPPPQYFEDLKEWEKAWRKRLDKAGQSWLPIWLKHQRRTDAYWAHASVNEDISRIKVPVLAVGGLADGYTNAPMRMADSLNKASRVLIGPWGHDWPDTSRPGPRIDFVGECLRSVPYEGCGWWRERSVWRVSVRMEAGGGGVMAAESGWELVEETQAEVAVEVEMELRRAVPATEEAAESEREPDDAEWYDLEARVLLRNCRRQQTAEGREEPDPQLRSILRRRGYSVGSPRLLAVQEGVCEVWALEEEGLAVKVMDRSALPPLVRYEGLPRETRLLGTLRHRHLVAARHLFRTHFLSVFVMKLAPLGSLSAVLEGLEGGRLPAGPEGRLLLRQAGEGLAYLHSVSVAHRDVKPENVLVDGGGNAVVGDLGFACQVVPGRLETRWCGTAAYCAPELLLHEPYDPLASDVFAFAVSLTEALTGALPYPPNVRPRTKVELQLLGHYHLPDDFRQQKDFVEVFTAAMSSHPHLRLPIDLLLRLPFFPPYQLFDQLPAFLRH